MAVSDDLPLVSVTVVTFNDTTVGKCLDSVFAQSGAKLQVIVVDNGSGDATREILSKYENRCELIWNSENAGFCAAQNQAIRQARGEWVLALNPDVLLEPGFISSLVAAGRLDESVGAVCGKLLHADAGLAIPATRQIDSAGIYFTPTFRHFDRGQHQPDGPAYDQPAYVFGATGAAALYRRKMIDDISLDGELFDEDFFYGRDDADLAWRAQLLGWKCLYVPAAVGYHVRRTYPAARRKLSKLINRHSVKNRFSMRIKNCTPSVYLRNFLPVTARDLGIVAYCLLREQSSLPAFSYVLRNWSRTWRKRKQIQARRRVSDAYIRQWFRFDPVTLPAPNVRGALPKPGASASGQPLPATYTSQPHA